MGSGALGATLNSRALKLHLTRAQNRRRRAVTKIETPRGPSMDGSLVICFARSVDFYGTAGGAMVLMSGAPCLEYI
jgi:hypothetical protein